ncbi:MAG: hypothetical protein K9L82_01635 [Chromatiaceae bacterium]|nr:hypothetical protein [Chromatiaceae bacterium]MCF8017614.1 hypothetical protein [Chromatiaceae bacterium]
MGGGAQRLLELWLDAKGDGGGLGTGHGVVCWPLAVDVLQGKAKAVTAQVVGAHGRQCQRAGFWMSNALYARILQEADEAGFAGRLD